MNATYHLMVMPLLVAVSTTNYWVAAEEVVIGPAFEIKAPKLNDDFLASFQYSADGRSDKVEYVESILKSGDLAGGDLLNVGRFLGMLNRINVGEKNSISPELWLLAFSIHDRLRNDELDFSEVRANAGAREYAQWISIKGSGGGKEEVEKAWQRYELARKKGGEAIMARQNQVMLKRFSDRFSNLGEAVIKGWDIEREEYNARIVEAKLSKERETILLRRL